jgi:hypothetical protein
VAEVVKRSDLDTVTVLRIIGDNDTPGGKVTGPVAVRYPDAPEKLILAKLDQLAGQGLIEYGTVITRCWLTDAGRQKLAEES